MKRLKSIGVGSVFRVSLVLGAVAGLLVGLILLITDLLNHQAAQGLITLLLAPILYGVIGALVNAFMAKVYNLVADRLGGIEINLE